MKSQYAHEFDLEYTVQPVIFENFEKINAHMTSYG